jgi:hypothetical protein
MATTSALPKSLANDHNECWSKDRSHAAGVELAKLSIIIVTQLLLYGVQLFAVLGGIQIAPGGTVH